MVKERPKKLTDEDVVPEVKMREDIAAALGTPFTLIIKPRKKRSEKVKLVFDDGSHITMSHRSTKPGLARKALLDLIIDTQQKIRTHLEKTMEAKHGTAS